MKKRERGEEREEKRRQRVESYKRAESRERGGEGEGKAVVPVQRVLVEYFGARR